MVQNIIVAIIILAALAYTAWSVYRSVRPGEKPNSACGGCTGCDLKNRINSCEHPIPFYKSRLKEKVFSERFVNVKNNESHL